VYTDNIVKRVCWILSLESGKTADSFNPVPSRSRIYQALLTEFETETNVDLAATIPSFLNEAMLILEEQ
jgi:hypothetical protein